MEEYGEIKVKYIGEDDPLSLRNGKIYNARVLKKNRYGIVDETEEEYAYPPERVIMRTLFTRLNLQYVPIMQLLCHGRMTLIQSFIIHMITAGCACLAMISAKQHL